MNKYYIELVNGKIREVGWWCSHNVITSLDYRFKDNKSEKNFNDSIKYFNLEKKEDLGFYEKEKENYTAINEVRKIWCEKDDVIE